VTHALPRQYWPTAQKIGMPKKRVCKLRQGCHMLNS
jgi:hypothetical protein